MCFRHGKTLLWAKFFDVKKNINSSIFYLWTKGFETGMVTHTHTPTTPHPLKTIWKFFAKLVLPRKQSLNLPVVFSKNVNFECSRQKSAFFPPKFIFKFFHNIFSVFLYICFTPPFLFAKPWHQRYFIHSTYPPQ